jgi:tryptophanyl-tRNA synthetase
MAAPGKMEDILRAGAEKARKLATPFTADLRRAVGLRDLRTQTSSNAVKTSKIAKPLFKQYRESDGRFYFKLLDADGRLLLQSNGFASPKDAGQAIGLLRTQGGAALPGLADKLQPNDEVDARDISASLQLMIDAD